MFERHFDRAVGLFPILVHNDDGFFVVGHGHIHYLRLVVGVLQGAEKLFNHGLGLGHVDVAHHNNALIGGMIPLFVVVAQFFGLEVIHNAHQSDGETCTIFASRI